MLAELFWPKEMRELVATYRDEDTLNEEAIKHIKSLNFKNLIFYTLFAILVGGFTKYYFGLIVILIGVIDTAFEIRRVFNNQIAVYSFGKKEELIFKKITFNGRLKNMSGSQVMHLFHPLENKAVIIKLLEHPRLKLSDKPDEESTVSIYYSKNDKYGSMPDFDYIKRKFCLNKNQLEL